MVARRIGPLYGKLVASPDYIRRHGAPETPEELAGHEALMQGTEAWQFLDGDEIITVHPRGRFKADNALALAAAALAGVGIAWIPDGVTDEYIASGALVPVMTRYPPPPAGIYLIRPAGQHPARKIRVLTDMLIDCFVEAPPPLGVGSAQRGEDLFHAGSVRDRSGRR
jgi:DNA-binding transcriptional LysR family regulator